MSKAQGIAQSANQGQFKNRIINGNFVIDQRNAGASITGNQNSFGVDRFPVEATQSSKLTVQQNAGSVTPPAGFTKYLGATSSSAYSVVSTDLFTIRQIVEGQNVADLGYGTANASTLTLSFWVRSSLTGTFSGAVANGTSSRNYLYTYTLTAANTWEYKTVTIPGDTSGTWGTDNGRGIQVRFILGVGSNYLGTAGSWTSSEVYGVDGSQSVVGTNGATFYITGVQLEKGSTATSFDYRPYGTELQLCQRYYWNLLLGDTAGGTPGPSGLNDTSTSSLVSVQYPQTMRTAPSLVTTGTAGNYRIRTSAGSSITCSSVPTIANSNATGTWVAGTVASGLTAGQACFLSGNSAANIYLGFNAEL